MSNHKYQLVQYKRAQDLIIQEKKRKQPQQKRKQPQQTKISKDILLNLVVPRLSDDDLCMLRLTCEYISNLLDMELEKRVRRKKMKKLFFLAGIFNMMIPSSQRLEYSN